MRNHAHCDFEPKILLQGILYFNRPAPTPDKLRTVHFRHLSFRPPGLVRELFTFSQCKLKALLCLRKILRGFQLFCQASNSAVTLVDRITFPTLPFPITLAFLPFLGYSLIFYTFSVACLFRPTSLLMVTGPLGYQY